MTKIVILAISSLFLLTSCSAGDLGSEIQAKLIPSWVAFLVQFASLIVLLIVVFIFAYKPVKKLLKKRSDYIENEIREAEQNKAISQRDMNQAKEMIIASKKEAASILKEAHEQAKINHDALVEQTKEEVMKMKLDAELDIKRSKQEALEEIHNEIVDVALTASKEILKREVNENDNARLVEEFIDKLD